ncbi:hypothetical protein ACFL2U_03390 [Patescibacteria group bacterium]
MNVNCPKCNHLIPTGNARCNLCGFEYQQHVKEQAQKSKKKSKNSPASIISSLLVFAVFIGVYYLIEKPYILFKYFSPEYFSPEKIFKIMDYFPIIFTSIIIIILGLSMVIVAKNKNK